MIDEEKLSRLRGRENMHFQISKEHNEWIEFGEILDTLTAALRVVKAAQVWVDSPSQFQAVIEALKPFREAGVKE